MHASQFGSRLRFCLNSFFRWFLSQDGADTEVQTSQDRALADFSSFKFNPIVYSVQPRIRSSIPNLHLLLQDRSKKRARSANDPDCLDELPGHYVSQLQRYAMVF